MRSTDLSHLAIPGSTLVIKAIPRASRNSIVEGPEGLRVHVTAAPESGKANAAILALLAKALDLPKSRLTLLQGDTSRVKRIRIRE